MDEILKKMYDALYSYITRDDAVHADKKDHFKIDTNFGTFEIIYKPKK